MSTLTFEFESTDNDGLTTTHQAIIPNFGTCIAECIRKLRARKTPSTTPKPVNVKMIIFLPETLTELYKEEELYDPNFAKNNELLELTIGNTTYVAVDQVVLQNWQEVIEVEWLG